MTPSDLLLYQRLRRLGIKIPVRMVMAARNAGLSIPLAASILIQESGGGSSLWGHDPTIFIGGYDALHKHQWGPIVTQQAYAEYKKQRGARGQGGMQGVGPCQLTFWSVQDEADSLGGCWRPLPNMRVGFRHLAANIRRSGLVAGVAAYNGTGAAANQYAATVINRANLFAAQLRLPRP